MSGIQISGIAANIAALARFKAGIKNLDAFPQIADTTAQRARAAVKVATGAAQATIRTVPGPNAAIVTAGDPGAGVDYAGVLDSGDPQRFPGDRFLTGPAEDDQAEKRARLETSLNALIRRHNT